MNLSLFLFLIGTLGFILNRKNIILMIICIEIMLLAVNNSPASSLFLSLNSALGLNYLDFLVNINILDFTFSVLGKEAINLIIKICKENPLQGAKQLLFISLQRI